MEPHRQATLDALGQLPETIWWLLLAQMQPLNRFLAEAVMDDPTPNQALDAAITAEIGTALSRMALDGGAPPRTDAG